MITVSTTASGCGLRFAAPCARTASRRRYGATAAACGRLRDAPVANALSGTFKLSSMWLDAVQACS